MRVLSLLTLTVFSFMFSSPLSAASSGSGGIKWYDDYAKAAADAKASNKHMLLFFTGSDWCGWCKKIEKEVFESPDFVKSAKDTFVFVDLDFPMNKQLPEAIASQNAALKKKFGITGFPTIVILDPSENFIAETGYRAGGGQSYADYLKSLIQPPQR